MSSEHTDRAAPGDVTLGLPVLWTGLRGIPAGFRAALAQGTITLAEVAAYAALVLAALVARLWDLGSRAMHHDESLHALYSYNLAGGEGFRHDPMMHGPFQMEATAGLFFLLGDSDFTARLLYALAGTVLVALPFFLRHRLGRTGALFAATMLAASPAMFYFSRFARNDILVAVWTLGLVIAMWRFLDEGKPRYLYWASGLLALAFATKESAYVITTILGSYLLVEMLSRNWSSITGLVRVGEANPLEALGQLIGGAWRTLQRGLRFENPSRQAGLFVLLFTLSLPLGAALVSVVQDTSLLSGTGLVLASPVGSPRIGAPSGGGMVIAAVTIGFLLWVSATLGSRWRWNVWWKCAAIFGVVWVLLYSTFFTNPLGIGSGIWQSLGYWIVQQDVARGNQPIYYYLVITPLYEFLPLVFALAGGVFYWRRRDRFGLFLVFWCVSTFLLYTYITEKMPWLLVNLALPLIILAAKFLGEIVEKIDWRRMWRDGGVLIVPGVPLFVATLWLLAFPEYVAEINRIPGLADISEDNGILGIGSLVREAELGLLATLAVLACLAVLGYWVYRRVGARSFWSVAAASFALLLLALTVRASWHAAYRNGDTPVEMLVYTQTSPDLAGVYRQIARSLDEGDGSTTVTIDQTGGFSWPWAWYLRGRQGVDYDSYSGPVTEAPDASILLLNADNMPESDDVMAERYGTGVRIPHRWWFPENYRGLTLGKLAGAVIDRDSWRTVMDYFLFRELSTSLGSSDAVVYVSPGVPIQVPQRP